MDLAYPPSLVQQPFPHRIDGDRLTADFSDLFLGIRQNCTLVEFKGGHGLHQALNLPFFVLRPKFPADLDRPSGPSTLFQDEIALLPPLEVEHFVTSPEELNRNGIFQELATVL